MKYNKSKAIAILTQLVYRTCYFGDGEYCYEIAIQVYNTLSSNTDNFENCRDSLFEFGQKYYNVELILEH